MSIIDHCFEPDSVAGPVCRCGAMMRLKKIEPHPADSAVESRFYACPACGHELKLMLWESCAA